MLEEGKILGPFRIKRVIGAGAMGTVYKAVFTENDQPVAIKVIGLGMSGNESAIARFEREAEILKQLRHPNIVRLFATGRYKKTPFFAMEYVRGESLDKMMDRLGRLPWEEVVRLGKQLCKALQHAHEKGIIHRDLKPSNLMVLKDGTLKLTDFGIAKDTDVTALTGANSTVGTAAYMSPEQCRGERNLTSKSDLYSLGVVFYELLTGEKPFKKDSPVDMFLAHVTEPFERPSRKVLDIPPWLDTLVCQLMEKKPEHRPFDAAMVRRVLDEVEEKMVEQRSAGLDMAMARVADRPNTKRDDTDRDAAMTLRSSTRKRKLRKKSKRFFEQRWFIAVSLTAVLAALVGLVGWLLRPTDPEVMYSRAESAIKSHNEEAARNWLRQYAEAYPNRDDAHALQMHAWLVDLQTDLLETQMHNRIRRPLSADGEAQQLIYAATRHEDAGEFDEARQRWQDLGKNFANAPNIDDQTWAWLAQRKVKALDAVPQTEAKLAEGRLQADFKPSSDAESRAFRALRLEIFGDITAAAAEWAQVKDMFIKDLPARPFVLLAAAKARALKPQVLVDAEQIKDHRRKLLATRLAELSQRIREISLQSVAAPASVREARVLARDFDELYGSDPDKALADMVKQAAALATQLPRS